MRTDLILTWLAGLMLVAMIFDGKPFAAVMMWALALVIVGTLTVLAQYAKLTRRKSKPMVNIQPRCRSADWAQR